MRKQYVIRKTRGSGSNKNMGVIGDNGMHWFVYDAITDSKIPGFTRETCRDGGFLRKKDAQAFIALIGEEVSA